MYLFSKTRQFLETFVSSVLGLISFYSSSAHLIWLTIVLKNLKFEKEEIYFGNMPTPFSVVFLVQLSYDIGQKPSFSMASKPAVPNHCSRCHGCSLNIYQVYRQKIKSAIIFMLSVASSLRIWRFTTIRLMWSVLDVENLTRRV